MSTVRNVSLLLVIVGALNWLLVGLFGFDLVAAVTGDSFGQRNALSNVVYVLVGVAGVASLVAALGTSKPVATVASRHDL